MNLDDIRNLQMDDIIRWPVKTKFIAVAVIFVLMGIGVWFELISPENSQYHLLQTKETALKASIREKQLLAASLPLYQAQIKTMNLRFQHFLKQLPNSTQIPSLLDNITLAGTSRGLDFQLFQPTKTINKHFYAEIPVKLKLVGTYHELGQFTAAIAAMPRIVTISDLFIARVPDKTKNIAKRALAPQKLTMSCVATTYRYIKHPVTVKKAKVVKK